MAAPSDVGIKAMEIYFPGQTLDQALFEKHQGVSAGKYTIGLGQKLMNFCNDREDACSLALTAVSGLLSKYKIDPQSIGRLEVGTESIVDKAKSVKTVLTLLFPGNSSLEGADTINACYGGTNALFNAVNWVESRSWDGRDAIVVASDIAIYDIPAARPTGGAGCVAMLVGPDAPLAFVPGLRGTFMTHAYDFYKPDFKAEFPLVDGQQSIKCYLSALDGCYQQLQKAADRISVDGSRFPEAKSVLSGKRELPFDVFDYLACHTPNCKLVSKSYGRLMYNDFLQNPGHDEFKDVPVELRELSLPDSLKSKELEKEFVKLSYERFRSRVEPGIAAPSVCGNMYTASLYCSLLSLLSNVDAETLRGKTIGMFSYGSGIASTLFTLRVVGDVSIIVSTVDLNTRLAARHVADADEYEAACKLRLAAYGARDYEPRGSLQHQAPGSYYLAGVDAAWRRQYAINGQETAATNGHV